MPGATLASPSSSPLSHQRKPSLSLLTRNINQVLLGSILFDTWFFSPYPDNIILAHGSNNLSHYSSTANANLQGIAVHGGSRHGASGTSIGTGVNGEKLHLGTGFGAVCPRLHVCPHCFAYTPHAADYVTHLRNHCHLMPSSERHRPESNDASPNLSSEEQRKSGIPASATKVYDYDGYAVWEVDGEVEKLYCQNLSLFGKLFLEQKSVFFDVSGFMYYVLTYTPPIGESVINGTSKLQHGSEAQTTAARRFATKKKPQNSSVKGSLLDDRTKALHTSPQTLGFFSKEKLSWDNNNLACIVIFPPYQHRSLGKLLMSVSYKLSGWEWEGGVIGGPEKPLSTMGRKSYTRFWEERVSRYMLGETRDADGRRILEKAYTKKKKPGKISKSKKKEVFSVKEIGERTGMLAEDVVVALIAMGVCTASGRKGSKKKQEQKEDHVNGGINIGRSQQTATDTEGSIPLNMVVKRSKVLDWVERHNVEIKDPIAEEGFQGEWALSDIDSDVEMDDDGHTGESDASD